MVRLRRAVADRDRRSRLYGALSGVAVFACADTALAHGGPLDRPVGWSDWNFDPVILVVLGLIGWTYALGLLRIWERAGRGRVLSGWQAGAFVAGMTFVLAALVSPLDPLSDQLASAHMTQHMILMTVAAPLVVAGSPALVMLWGLSPEWRHTLARAWSSLAAWRAVCHWLWQPLVVWTLYAVVMWLWHAPALYDAALANAFVHDVQHVTFFIAACLFWRVLLDPISRFRLAGPLAVVYLFATTLHATVLGVLMTLAPTPWYSGYEGRTALWGITTLEDQQLAGLIMWMPACVPYLVVAVVLLARVLEGKEVSGVRCRVSEARTQCPNRITHRPTADRRPPIADSRQLAPTI